MKLTIPNRYTFATLYEGEHDSLKRAVEHCAQNKISLREANLRWANLREADLRGADLREADLSGADLRWADLREANLHWADLREANLHWADLREADLSGAEIPIVPDLHRQMLAAIEARPETFEMGSWHGQSACGTTHCRAGWAIHLAGEAGYALERAVGASAAGAFIIAKSCPWLERVPNFTASNKAALEDIRTCAAREAWGLR